MVETFVGPKSHVFKTLFLQMSNNLKVMSHCHVIGWNMDCNLVQALWDSGNFTFISSGVSEDSGVAQLFLSFRQRTTMNTIKSQLEQLGACEVVLSSSENDGGKFAGTALYSVQEMAKKNGCTGLVLGECGSLIAKRAQEKRLDEQKAAAAEEHMFDAKTAEAMKMSMNDIKEGQAALKQDVTQISERMASHEDIHGLRQDSVNVLCDMEKRLLQSQDTTVELQKTVKQLQMALDKAQSSEDKTKETLLSTIEHLTDEQAKNNRQAVMLAKLNQNNALQKLKIDTLETSKKRLELENTKLKTTLSGLQDLQTLRQDMGSIKTFLETTMGAKFETMQTTMGAKFEMMQTSMGAKFEMMQTTMHQETGDVKALLKTVGDKINGQGDKLERLQTQGDNLTNVTGRIEMMHAVAFTNCNTYADAEKQVRDEVEGRKKRQYSQMMEEED